MQKQISKEITRVKKLIKVFAKQHDAKTFINRVNPLQKMINDLFGDLFITDTPAYNQISYKQKDFNDFVDKCWRYCQGDLRIDL